MATKKKSSKKPKYDKGNVQGQLGKILKNKIGLDSGCSYCIADGKYWNVGFEYVGQTRGKHRFNDTLKEGADDISFSVTDKELDDMIAAGKIAIQK